MDSLLHARNEKMFEIIKINETCIRSELILQNYENLSEELICSICLDIVYNPVTCSVCSSPFGSKCLEDWFRRDPRCPKQCTYEKAEFSLLLKRLVNKFEFFCFYKTDGCNKILTYENFYSHVNSCKFGNYKCLHIGCNYIDKLDEIQIHVTKCLLKPEICPICNAKILRKELIEHERNPIICHEQSLRKIAELQSIISRLNEERNSLERTNFFQKRQITFLKKKLKENNISTDIKENLIVKRSKSQDKRVITGTNNLHKSQSQAISAIFRGNEKIISRLQNEKGCTHEFDLNAHSQIEEISCMICKTNDLQISWGCSKCHIHVCILCFNKEHKNTSVFCSNNHFLAPRTFYESKINKVACDDCKKRVSYGSCYWCEICNYEMCMPCFKKNLLSKLDCSIF